MRATFCLPSYEKGLSSAIVVHASASKVTLPLKTRSLADTLIQSFVPVNDSLLVATIYTFKLRVIAAFA